MAATLLLDPATWDLAVDANGNIAVAEMSLGLAQDAASAIKTFLGEYWWDTTIGIDYLGQILGKPVALALVKQAMVNAALTVPGIVTAQAYLTALNERSLTGQIQIVPATGGNITAANFTVINPQGGT